MENGNDAIRIEPCPFCGCSEFDADCVAAEYATVEPRARSKDTGMLRVNVDGFGWYWVSCGMCHAQGPKYHGERYGNGNTGPKNFRRDRDRTRAAIKTAIEAWNGRDVQTRIDWEVASDG